MKNTGEMFEIVLRIVLLHVAECLALFFRAMRTNSLVLRGWIV